MGAIETATTSEAIQKILAVEATREISAAKLGAAGRVGFSIEIGGVFYNTRITYVSQCITSHEDPQPSDTVLILRNTLYHASSSLCYVTKGQGTRIRL